jgi:hypothetical protein
LTILLPAVPASFDLLHQGDLAGLDVAGGAATLRRMNPDNLTPAEASRLAAFNEVIAKLRTVGWVEQSASGLAGEYKDVTFTPKGAASLLNVHSLEQALGGLTGDQARMLFYIARKLAHDKPDTN